MKLEVRKSAESHPESRPARGAWIETQAMPALPPQPEGRAPRGARGLKLAGCASLGKVGESRPARGAWIETTPDPEDGNPAVVAPRAGRVD